MLKTRTIALMLSAAAFAMPLAGCSGSGVVYDPYRQDYHRWNRGEDRLYRQWETGSHRGHTDFQRRSPGEQRAYWGWRHK